MTPKIPHLNTANTSEKRPISNPGAIFSKFPPKNPHCSLFGLVTIFLTVLLLLTGCRSPQQPVVVQVSEPPVEGGRFRTTERQRDVWIAPQVVDNETLQHEQTVTFVERPAAWQLPAVIEPHTVSNPDLPLEQGEYDAEPLRRQQEILADTQAKVHKLNEEMEKLKAQAQAIVKSKDTQAQDLTRKLESTQQELTAANQKLADIETAEKQRQEEAAKKARTRWWRLWKRE